jgi:tetratricopeptide (TPR) repeat protein
MPETSTSPTIELAEARAKLKEPLLAKQILEEIMAKYRPDTPDRDLCETHYMLGVCHRLLGEHDEAEGELLYAHQLARVLHERVLEANCAIELSMLSMVMMQNDRAIAMLNSAIELLSRPEDTLRRAQATFTLANAFWLGGNQEEALRRMEQALLEFTQVDSEDGIVAVLCGLVHIDMDRGHEAAAEERIELCFKLLPQNSHGKNKLFLQLALAECYIKRQRYDRASEILRSVTSDARAEGYHIIKAQGFLQLSAIHRHLGKKNEAQDLRGHAFELARMHGFTSALEAIEKKFG